MSKESYYLISFEYEMYCQGYEWAKETLLVKAKDYTYACHKILDTGLYYNAKNFVNMTIE